jgi:hypothetical protein
MYRHLLVPVERSDACVEAIGHAAQLARSLGARITFVCRSIGESRDAAQQRHAEALLARAEAAARAQGVPASVQAAQRSATFEGFGQDTSSDYDLVCVAQGSAVPPLPGVAVLVCPGDARPTVTKVVATLLGAHRARSDAYDDTLAALRAKRTGQPGIDAAQPSAMRATIERLVAEDVDEKALMAALRERTSSLDAELDELARLAERETDLLARIVESLRHDAGSALNDEAIEDMLHACARVAWERMGRIEGVVLPASRSFLRDADWNTLAYGTR